MGPFSASVAAPFSPAAWCGRKLLVIQEVLHSRLSFPGSVPWDMCLLIARFQCLPLENGNNQALVAVIWMEIRSQISYNSENMLNESPSGY